MRPPPRLIVFEGPDGVGKTTLALALVDRLRTHGVSPTYLSFPGGQPGTLGHHVRQLHHDPRIAGITRLNPTSLQLLHVAAHIDTIESQVLPAFDAGRTVVLDRFWWSTWVYGIVTGADIVSVEQMLAIERHHWRGILPSVVFLLSRPGADRDLFTARLTAEYEAVADRADHAVSRVVNAGHVSDVIDLLLERLAATSVLSPTPPKNPPPPTQNRSRTIFSRLSPAKPTVVYDTLWRFAVERQEIFFRRLRGLTPPWTDDPILRDFKFTNVYRASDRVSQYLIRHVIYPADPSPREVFFRVVLFKLFNRIETWQLLRGAFGEPRATEYSPRHYDSVLARALKEGRRIYSPAYIMPSGGLHARGSKHSMHLRLLQRMLLEDVPDRLAGAKTMRAAYEILLAYPTIGPFLAYQYVIDLNYSPLLDFSEMEFVVPGPGARDGLRKCFSDFGGLTEVDLIRVVTEAQQAEFERRGLLFRTLWGRPLQLVDCQNLFCEIDKYARLRHPEFAGFSRRTRIKQRFKTSGPIPSPWYPPKWVLNDALATELTDVHRF